MCRAETARPTGPNPVSRQRSEPNRSAVGGGSVPAAVPIRRIRNLSCTGDRRLPMSFGTRERKKRESEEYDQINRDSATYKESSGVVWQCGRRRIRAVVP